MWAEAALVPLIAVLPGRVTPGVIYGAMFFLHPTWSATVGAYTVRLTPDELQGRVLSITTMLSLGLVAFASLGSGFLIEAAGTTPTLLVLFGLMTAVSIAAVLSRSVKDAPATLLPTAS